jgi:opacity protein-like surface antigen
MRRAIVFVAVISSLATTAGAQESRSEIALQGTGFFTKGTNGTSGNSYTPTQTGGFLVSYRYHLHHGLSVEGAYGFNRNTQKFSYSTEQWRIPTNNHQFTGALVQTLPSFGKARFSPYILVGGGAYALNPMGGQSNTVTLSGAQTQTKGAFLYGGGVNYAMLRRMSLRFEYRGLLYSAPSFGFSAFDTGSATHSAQPSVGVAFHF